MVKGTVINVENLVNVKQLVLEQDITQETILKVKNNLLISDKISVNGTADGSKCAVEITGNGKVEVK